MKGAIERKHQLVAAREMAAVSLENDLARIKVDALNTAASNVVLKSRLDALTVELRGKDELVQRYEIEICRRNDEIEKKELAISNLGRKLDAMKAKAGVDAANSKAADEEAMGPLEATIRQLRAEIETKAAESAEMQRQWIRGQTELVTLENDNVRAAADAAIIIPASTARSPSRRARPHLNSRLSRLCVPSPHGPTITSHPFRHLGDQVRVDAGAQVAADNPQPKEAAHRRAVRHAEP